MYRCTRIRAKASYGITEHAIFLFVLTIYSLAYLAMLFIAGDTGDGIVFIYKDYRWPVFFGFFRCHRSITHQNDMVAYLNLSGSGTI